VYFYREADAGIGSKYADMTIRYGHRTRISQTNDCKIFFSKRIVQLYSKTEKWLQVTTLCDVFLGSQINNDMARLVESPTARMT